MPTLLSAGNPLNNPFQRNNALVIAEISFFRKKKILRIYKYSS